MWVGFNFRKQINTTKIDITLKSFLGDTKIVHIWGGEVVLHVSVDTF